MEWLVVELAIDVCHNLPMERSDVLQILRDHERELKADGIVHLRVFGSVGRGEGSRHSDVDLLADFDASKRLTLVTLGRLQGRLSELLGVEVDLSSLAWMKEPVRTKAMQEAVRAF
ncbi:MAG TPA: nucleotidyltransferase domain-containing protein [Edaphobacter sp.]